jgi:hypothetical protein
MPLTDRAIRNAKAFDKPIRLFDEKCPYLEVAPSGGSSWRFKYRFGGKEKRFSLGVYPDTNLAGARDRRDEARALLADGKDPSAMQPGGPPTATRSSPASGTKSKRMHGPQHTPMRYCFSLKQIYSQKLVRPLLLN